MVEYTDSKGNIHQITLDLDEVIRYEEEHPDWSIIDEIDKVSGKFRFSTLDRLVRFLGMASWTEFTSKGLGFEDLVKIFTEALRESGFPISVSEA